MKRKSITALIVSATITGISSLASATDSDNSMYGWQLSLLFEPSPQQIKVEDRGRVVIYDGMYSADIDRAFEEQFDRVEKMMFVNTVITDAQGVPAMDPDTGDVLTEDDGCD